jgi:hypothetical protein
VAFARDADVEAALGRPLGGLDVSFLLETATDLILGYLNTDISGVPDPLPPLLTRVCAEMVANVINRPQSPPDPTDDAYTLGPYAYHVGPSSVGPWLNSSQMNRLSIYRQIGWVIECVSEIVGTDVAPDISATFDPYAGTDLQSTGNAQDAP